MRICDLKNKEVINVCDGKMIGYVSDVDFDIHRGAICSIIVPGPLHLFSWCARDHEYVIPYSKIECIGPDAILVKACLEEVRSKCN